MASPSFPNLFLTISLLKIFSPDHLFMCVWKYIIMLYEYVVMLWGSHLGNAASSLHRWWVWGLEIGNHLHKVIELTISSRNRTRTQDLSIFCHTAYGSSFSGCKTFSPKFKEFTKKTAHHKVSLNIIWLKGMHLKHAITLIRIVW